MADPVGTFSGLSSGIQWRDMVDQIMQLESQRRLDPVTARQTALNKRADAWHQLQGLVAKFRDAADALRSTTSFDQFAASAAKSPSTSRDLVGVSASSRATPGNYDVEVVATARAEKIGGGASANSSTALGVTGSFAINGRVISVVAQDTLTSLRDKINATNSGSAASGVSASVVAATGGAKLVVTADATGLSGIELTDDAAGTLATLGFVAGPAVANLDPDGASQTYRFNSDVSAIAANVAVDTPPATTINVGGTSVSVDLAADSLQEIADRINTVSGNPSLASVTTETVLGRATYRLVTSASVTADATGSAADSARALSVLGFTAPPFAHEVIEGANAVIRVDG
ncbi:MAG TPA: flagellar cap protein FliD N-terminal domain-containing protein, partial [Gemmatimonadaceae bacterium]|nr:flagellar cap protein FliD N-terminal domain-containing protein [Gemmatimonadaceae bacterium]